MSPLSMRAHIETAILARLKDLSVQFPIDTHVWEDLDNTSDSDLASLSQDAAHEISVLYHTRIRAQAGLPMGSYETIKQLLLSAKIYEHIVRRGMNQPKKLAQRSEVITEAFLFLFIAVKKTLGPVRFSEWHSSLIGCLIDSAAQASIRFHREQKMSTDGSETDSDSEPPVKKQKRTASGFAQAFKILSDVREARTDAAKPMEVLASSSADVACIPPKVSRKFLATRSTKRATDPKPSKARIPALPTSTSGALTLFAFAPRLSPRPRLMPGAWPASRSPSPATAFPFSSARPSLLHAAGQDNFSRFPRRSSASHRTTHFCPLAPAF
ncbi:hypothetical protein DFH06DRAFT_1229682 [Mycena polygramma]|nr:hypothetical protein DFH06DRAFT_1229682 [Mycena polygramma]